ncbi:Activator of 90 kDa heat shock protein ATPase 1, partial [Fasciola gigantica]
CFGTHLIIFFHGFVSGQRKNGDNKTKFRGKLEVMNLSEEYSIDELDILISCTSSTADGDAVRKFMQTDGVRGIQGKLAEYLKTLKEEYSQNLILPTKGGTNLNQSQVPTKQPAEILNQINQTTMSDGQISRKPKDLSTKQLTLTEEFFCTPDDLYKVLTTKEVSSKCLYCFWSVSLTHSVFLYTSFVLCMHATKFSAVLFGEFGGIGCSPGMDMLLKV